MPDKWTHEQAEAYITTLTDGWVKQMDAVFEEGEDPRTALATMKLRKAAFETVKPQIILSGFVRAGMEAEFESAIEGAMDAMIRYFQTLSDYDSVWSHRADEKWTKQQADDYLADLMEDLNAQMDAVMKGNVEMRFSLAIAKLHRQTFDGWKRLLSDWYSQEDLEKLGQVIDWVFYKLGG